VQLFERGGVTERRLSCSLFQSKQYVPSLGDAPLLQFVNMDPFVNQ
jgi:hypothetical protein